MALAVNAIIGSGSSIKNVLPNTANKEYYGNVALGCTLLTGQNALVLKVDMSYRWRRI